jgi:putative iron-dependent peroxidase
MATPQSGVLAPVPAHAALLSFRFAPGADARVAVRAFRDGSPDRGHVVGLGEPLTRALGLDVPGLRPFPALVGAGVSVPSTQEALFVLLRADDRGALFDTVEEVRGLAGRGLIAVRVTDAFRYGTGRDLTGYEDGTENPTGDAAVAAAIVAAGPLAGSSFIAVQRWEHDLERFRAFAPELRDATIGRAIADNEELGDAPPTAHVKRSAQESFDPEAFMVRRSMPWATGEGRGLEFIAFGESLDRYERVLRRMVGLDDGVVDALFTFSRPVNGGYYWCPPTEGGRLVIPGL